MPRRRDGEVRIRQREGTVFVLRPKPRESSPLDVPAVKLNVSSAEIVQFVREERHRAYR